MTDIVTVSGTTLYWNCSFNQTVDWHEDSLSSPAASYRVRFGFAKHLIREDLHEEYKRLIGTVTVRGYPRVFPPAEVVDALSKHYGRPLVAARHTESLDDIEYNGSSLLPFDPEDTGHSWVCPISRLVRKLKRLDCEVTINRRTPA